jgi:3-hydroxyisobutyrate dehydrogenase-like beta-hydroxyacid dehydrogenase
VSAPATVASLGLGIIGGTWAGHYHADGVLAASWNRTPKPGVPLTRTTAREAAASAAVVHLCLGDPASVDAVLEDILPVLRRGTLVIQSSTIDPASATAFEARAQAAGLAYLEAPFTGSKPAAAARRNVFYLGGNAGAKTAAAPFLERLSEARIDAGTVAQAASLKLAMNLQIAGIMEALAESLVFARRAGIGDDVFFDTLRRNVAQSGLAALKEPKLRAGDFAPQFSVKHMHKDMRLASASAAGSGLPLLATVRDCLRRADEAGWGDDDFCSVIRLAADAKGGPR